MSEGSIVDPSNGAAPKSRLLRAGTVTASLFLTVLSAIGQFVGRHKIVTTIVLLVGLGWMAAIPSGELRLAAYPEVTGDATKLKRASELFSLADSSIEHAAALHRQLWVDAKYPQQEIVIPAPAAPTEQNLKKFVPDLNFGTPVEVKDTGFSVGVNLLAILEEAYRWFGFTNYFLIFQDLTEVDCPKPSATKCYRVVVQYWPSLMHSEVLVGDEAKLAEDLALFELRGALRNEGDDWRENSANDAAPPFIMAAETPSTMPALEAAAAGMQILRQGTAHNECLGKSKDDCIVVAITRFNESIEEEKLRGKLQGGNVPIAALGLALIEIQAALEAARGFKPDLAVQDHLTKAEVLTNIAMQSRFLRAALEPGKADMQFQLLDLEGLTPDDNLTALSQQLRCVLADYRRAMWSRCLAKLDKIADVPSAMQPYTEAARLNATLNSAPGPADFQREFTSLKERIASLDPNSTDANLIYVLRRTMLEQSCEKPDVLDAPSFDSLVADTVDNAPHELARQEAQIQVAFCREGQAFPKDVDVDEILTESMAMPDGIERQRRMLLLSQTEIRRGKMEDAFEFAKDSLSLSWAGAYIRNSKAFAPLRDRYGPDLLDLTFSPAKFMDTGTCR